MAYAPPDPIVIWRFGSEDVSFPSCCILNFQGTLSIVNGIEKAKAHIPISWNPRSPAPIHHELEAAAEAEAAVANANAEEVSAAPQT